MTRAQYLTLWTLGTVAACFLSLAMLSAIEPRPVTAQETDRAVESLDVPPPTDRETVWSKWLAHQYRGQAEARTLDGSRVDVLTDSDAWEVEWSHKWKEAPGQALLYATMTDRRPGVMLLMTGEPNEERNALRCAIVCARAGVALHFIDTATGERK